MFGVDFFQITKHQNVRENFSSSKVERIAFLHGKNDLIFELRAAFANYAMRQSMSQLCKNKFFFCIHRGTFYIHLKIYIRSDSQ